MAVGSPKKPTTKGSSASPKIPEPADLSDAKVGASKWKGVRDGKIHIYQVAFCDDGSTYGEDFSGPMAALHLMHAYPNVWFMFLASLGAYCEFRHETDDSYPEL